MVRASHRLYVVYHTVQWQWERKNRDSYAKRLRPLANRVTYLPPEGRNTCM